MFLPDNRRSDELPVFFEGRADTYAQVGARLGLSETAVKVTVHRLRQRFRELLREEIAHTVARPEEVVEEMRYLFEVVSR